MCVCLKTTKQMIKMIKGKKNPTMRHVSRRNGHLHAARRDSDHLAPVGGRHDSFIKVERNVAGKIIRGTDVRNQEVRDRFLPSPGNIVEI